MCGYVDFPSANLSDWPTAIPDKEWAPGAQGLATVRISQVLHSSVSLWLCMFESVFQECGYISYAYLRILLMLNLHVHVRMCKHFNWTGLL